MNLRLTTFYFVLIIFMFLFYKRNKLHQLSKKTEPILYKQSIIDAKNSKDAYVFNEAEFEYMSKKLLEDKQIDLEKYKVNS